MRDDADLTNAARSVFGGQLRGLFAFWARVRGDARPDSDLDVAVWLYGPLRRSSTWIPWCTHFHAAEPTIDPTFFTATTLAHPSGWLLEAVHGGTRVLYDPSGELHERLAAIQEDLRTGRQQRRLFMGLPYYEAART